VRLAEGRKAKARMEIVAEKVNATIFKRSKEDEQKKR
jgi:hypothetical protein